MFDALKTAIMTWLLGKLLRDVVQQVITEGLSPENITILEGELDNIADEQAGG